MMGESVIRRVDDRRGATVSSPRHRHTPVRFVLAIVLLAVPSAATGQDATTHSRWEFGGAAGLAVLGGDAFGSTRSGVALSTHGAYHVGSGWTLRFGAGRFAGGDRLIEAGVQNVAAAAPSAGVAFDGLMLSVGLVYRFSPPAALVTPYLGGEVAHMNGTGWGGGVIGGMTFWFTNGIGFDTGFTVTTVQEAGQAGSALGHVVTLTGGFVLGLR